MGNPEEVTITELAKKIISTAGADVGIDYIPYEKAYEEGFEDMLRRVPDITKVQVITGHSPQVSLNDALLRIRDWFVKERIVEESSGLPTCSGAWMRGVCRMIKPGAEKSCWFRLLRFVHGSRLQVLARLERRSHTL